VDRKPNVMGTGRRIRIAKTCMVRFRCMACGGEAVLDAYMGQPVCPEDGVDLEPLTVVRTSPPETRFRGRLFVRPTRSEILHKHALLVAERSTCSRKHVGCVISRDGRILVTGYNGAPAGMPHCNHDCDCGYPGEGGRFFEGVHLSNCASLMPCTISVHAEANAIAFAARYGMSVDGAEVTTTCSPCLSCSQLIINAGIIHVQYFEEYRDQKPLELLLSAGVALSFFSDYNDLA
jgi:dCMP deaminase